MIEFVNFHPLSIFQLHLNIFAASSRWLLSWLVTEAGATGLFIYYLFVIMKTQITSPNHGR